MDSCPKDEIDIGFVVIHPEGSSPPMARMVEVWQATTNGGGMRDAVVLELQAVLAPPGGSNPVFALEDIAGRRSR
jgi:hypothetical protein